MYNEFETHKRSDKIKWIAVLIAIVVLFAGVLAALIPTYVGEEKHTENNMAIENNPVVMQTIRAEGISLAMSPMSEAVSTTNTGVVGTATVTATIEPADTQNKEVEWAVAFKDAQSPWATGKTVTDYITVEPTESGSLTATVTCKQAFGEPIEIKVTSKDNPACIAIVQADYIKRIESVSVVFNPKPTYGESYEGRVVITSYNNCSIVPTYGTGTIFGRIKASMVMTVNSTLQSRINEALRGASGSFSAKNSISVSNAESFVINLTDFYSGGGDNTTANRLINNLLYESGFNESGNGAPYCGFSDVTMTIELTYDGKTVQTYTHNYGGIGISKKYLSYESVVTNITTDKTELAF